MREGERADNKNHWHRRDAHHVGYIMWIGQVINLVLSLELTFEFNNMSNTHVWSIVASVVAIKMPVVHTTVWPANFLSMEHIVYLGNSFVNCKWPQKMRSEPNWKPTTYIPFHINVNTRVAPIVRVLKHQFSKHQLSKTSTVKNNNCQKHQLSKTSTV